VYTCANQPEIKAIQHLLPINTLIGSNEHLPGLHRPSIGAIDGEIQLTETQPLYLHKIRVNLTDDVNRLAMNYIINYRREKGYEDVKTPGSVKEIRFNVGQHNGWKFLLGS
jgi:hypothetical protein